MYDPFLVPPSLRTAPVTLNLVQGEASPAYPTQEDHLMDDDKVTVTKGKFRKVFKKYHQETVTHRTLGVTAEVYLDPKDGHFFCYLADGRALSCPVRKTLVSAVEDALGDSYQLHWERMIEIVELHPGWTFSSEREREAPFVGFTFSRFQRALRKDGQWLEIDWDETLEDWGRGRPQDMRRKGRLIAYSDVAWEGLINIQEQVRQLHQRLHGAFFHSDLPALTDGLAFAASATLPLLLTDHGSVNTLPAVVSPRFEGEAPLGDLTDLVRAFQEWCFEDQHPDAISPGDGFFARCPDLREGNPPLSVSVSARFGQPVVVIERKEYPDRDPSKPLAFTMEHHHGSPAWKKGAFTEDEVETLFKLVQAGCTLADFWNGAGIYSLSLRLSVHPRTPALRTLDNLTVARRQKLPETDPVAYAQRVNAFRMPKGWR